MLTEDYTVRLDQFQGPLDLLLYLARKAEVDLATLPLAAIADQYVEHLGGIEEIDIDLAGEFLVMAATLMELKSRLVSPAPPADVEQDPAAAVAARAEEDAPDLRTVLIHQLLAYKAYRDAADALERRGDEWRRRFAIAPAATDRAALREAVQRRADSIEIEDLGLYDIISAYEGVLERVDFDLLGAHHVVYEDDIPIEEHAADLVDRLAGFGAPTPLQDFFRGRTRGQVVGLFVATLELVRRHRVRIDQRAQDGAFVLSLLPESDVDAEPDSETDQPPSETDPLGA